MNVKLLRKVKRYILAEPRRLNMANWLKNADELYYIRSNKRRRPPCGTVGCVAGTTCIVAGIAKKTVKDGVATYLLPISGIGAAQKALGLTYEQACRLFLVGEDWADRGFQGHIGHWPEQFSADYSDEHNTPLKNAKILAARIEHFIKTKGRE